MDVPLTDIFYSHFGTSVACFTTTHCPLEMCDNVTFLRTLYYGHDVLSVMFLQKVSQAIPCGWYTPFVVTRNLDPVDKYYFRCQLTVCVTKMFYNGDVLAVQS